MWRPEGVFTDPGLLDLVVWIYFPTYAEWINSSSVIAIYRHDSSMLHVHFVFFL